MVFLYCLLNKVIILVFFLDFGELLIFCLLDFVEFLVGFGVLDLNCCIVFGVVLFKRG